MLEKIESFSDKESCARVLAEKIARLARHKIEEQGVCSLAFSGGSTPRQMFEFLSEQPLDWSRVQITLVDERCVDPDHERSNARLLSESLLDKVDGSVKFFPLFLSSESEEVRAARLEDIHQPFDLVHLGMGEDAHTASFFPDAANIAEMLDLQSGKDLLGTRSEASREERLTWSLGAVARAGRLVLQISGEGKHRVIIEALNAMSESRDAGSREDLRLKMPIVAVLELCHITGAQSDQDWGKTVDGPSPLSIFFAES